VPSGLLLLFLVVVTASDAQRTIAKILTNTETMGQGGRLNKTNYF